MIGQAFQSLQGIYYTLEWSFNSSVPLRMHGKKYCKWCIVNMYLACTMSSVQCTPNWIHVDVFSWGIFGTKQNFEQFIGIWRLKCSRAHQNNDWTQVMQQQIIELVSWELNEMSTLILVIVIWNDLNLRSSSYPISIVKYILQIRLFILFTVS